MQHLTCTYATTFHLTVPPTRAAETPSETAAISNLYPTTQYGNNVTLNIEKTNAYLSSRIDTVHKNCGHKAAAKRGNTSNMFTCTSEHHPSVKI